MSFNQDKLMAFQEAIQKETDEKIAQIEQEIKEYEATELDKVRDDAYNQMFTYMQDQVHNIQNRYKQSITKYELESKRNILLFRNKLAETVFEQVKEKLIAFAASKEYESYLLEHIQTTLKDFPCENGITICMRKEDLKYSEEIQKALPCRVQIKADPKNHLGGFFLLNEAQGVMEDKTFSSALDDQHRYFYETCGLSIQY